MGPTKVCFNTLTSYTLNGVCSLSRWEIIPAPAAISGKNTKTITIIFLQKSTSQTSALNVRLSAYPDSASSWAFTTKEGGYTKLPTGSDAVVTGVSLQHDSLFFGSRKIKITDKLSVRLSMAYISKKDLKDSLEAVLK